MPLFLYRKSLEIVLPILVFVNFIEEQDFCIAPEAILKDVPAIRGVIPIQIMMGGEMILADKTGQTCFADLPGAANEDHFFMDIRKNVWR